MNNRLIDPRYNSIPNIFISKFSIVFSLSPTAFHSRSKNSVIIEFKQESPEHYKNPIKLPNCHPKAFFLL